MGSKYPILPPKTIIKILKKLGFSEVSQKGSHLKLKKESPKKLVVIIPMHDEIAKGTLKSILEQANLDIDHFLEFLK
jgi:predicted RNA binding protein YcfA (HicA-like mRNA interferase family)